LSEHRSKIKPKSEETILPQCVMGREFRTDIEVDTEPIYAQFRLGLLLLVHIRDLSREGGSHG
jgi:hypothetical protein